MEAEILFSKRSQISPKNSQDGGKEADVEYR
jgi:hypothetical protein